MIKEYNQLSRKKHMHTEWIKICCFNKEIKCNNIIKQCKNVYLQLYYRRRHERT